MPTNVSSIHSRRPPDTAVEACRSALATRFTCHEFRPIRKGSLIGWAKIGLPSGLVVPDCGLFQNTETGARWAMPPSRAVLGRDGRQQTDGHGKLRWQPMLEFASKAVRDKWSDAAVAAVVATDPKAFGASE